MVTAEQRRTAVREAIATATISERRACRDRGGATGGSPCGCAAKGYGVNRKLVYRLYRELGLAVRRRKRGAVARSPLVVPEQPNERWSMDFVTDALAGGRRFRTLSIVDDFTREGPARAVDHGLSGGRVTQVLEPLAQTRWGCPTRSLPCPPQPLYDASAFCCPDILNSSSTRYWMNTLRPSRAALGLRWECADTQRMWLSGHCWRA